MRRELQVEPLVLCLVQPAPSGTPTYKPRTISDQHNKKNRNHNGQVNKNQSNVHKGRENTKQNVKNQEEEVTGRTRRRRSALTT